MPVLRDCPQLDGPFQRNGQGCWFVRLRSKPPQSRNHSSTDPKVCESQRWNAHQRKTGGDASTSTSVSLPPIETVHVGVGENSIHGLCSGASRHNRSKGQPFDEVCVCVCVCVCVWQALWWYQSRLESPRKTSSQISHLR